MLARYHAPTEVKLAALWTATMLCYIYCDYFGLFVAGRLDAMNRGMIGPLGAATDGVLVGVSLMMAIPSLMVALSILMPPALAKWANVVLGLAYSGIEALTMIGAPPFYMVMGSIEVVLTLTIALTAWRWPRA